MNEGAPITSSKYVTELQTLRLRGGNPSLRALGRRVGSSHSTLSRIFRGDESVSWEVTRNVVAELDGDERYFRTLWYDHVHGDDEVAPTDALDAKFYLRGSLAIGVVVTYSVMTTLITNQHANQTFRDATQAVAAVVTIWSLIRLGRSQRTTWPYVLAAGTFLWAVALAFVILANDIRAVVPLRWTPYSGLLYSVLPATALLAIVMSAHGSGHVSRARARRIGQVCLAAAAAVAAIVMTTTLAAATGPPREFMAVRITNSALYLTFDIAVIAAAVVIMRAAREYAPYMFYLLAFALFTLSDLVFFFHANTGDMSGLPPGADLGYTAGLCCMYLLSISHATAVARRSAQLGKT